MSRDEESTTTTINSMDERLAEVLDAAIEAVRKGVPLDREELASRHPELADALQVLDQLVGPEATQASGLPLHSVGAHPEQIGPYRILRHLGTGSFGIVYLAFDPDVRRKVALKVLHPERLAQPEVVVRFQREAWAIARLQHPGIVQLYEYSRQGPPFYLVCEFVEGQDPRLWIKQKNSDLDSITDLAARIGEAMEHAHGQGVCHRDLKPGNILVDEAGNPHILDFGLARLESSDDSAAMTEHTSDGRILGSLAYMAPEQAAGFSRSADARSDVYALGVILYELLTGQLPFQGPPHSLPARVLEEEPVSPRTLNSDVPRDVEAICLKAMSKRPVDRYATAADFAGDLRRHLRGESVRAQRLTWRHWVQRALNRAHRDFRGGSWTLLLLLLGVTIFVGCSVANYFELTLPREQRWLPMLLTKFVQVGVMLYLVVRVRPIKEPSLSSAERQIWCLLPGYYGGFLTLVLLNFVLPTPLPMAPILAVMSGMGVATLGATIWGWEYVWGAFFFGLAVVIGLFPPYGLTILGLGWFVVLAINAVHLYRSR